LIILIILGESTSYEAPHYVSPTYRHFISLRSKYSPQHPVSLRTTRF
jgi:hypothetical protein